MAWRCCSRCCRHRPAFRGAPALRRSVRWPSDNGRAMSRIYALANQKGGVGKTTTAVNLAACLAEAGERALVIDLDPQANATSGLGMRANGSSSYDLLDGAPLAELVHPTAFANLDLVPAKPDLAGAVVELSGRSDGERYLAQALASGSDRYDFVFLDCPPSLGPLTVNALAAADRVLVPVQAEYYALEGLTQLLHSVELIRRRLNPSLGIGGLILTMVDGRTRLAHQVEEEVRRHFGDLVFRTSVPRSVRLAEAPSHGLPAIAYDRRSAGADAYWKVAMELVVRPWVLPTAPRPPPRPRGPDRRSPPPGPAARDPGRRDPPEPAPATAPLRARGGLRAGGVGAAAGRDPAPARAPARCGRLRDRRRRAPLAGRARGGPGGRSRPRAPGRRTRD